MTMREQLQERVGKGHLSYSSLKYALGDMRLWEMYMRGELRKESEALRFGTLYDMLLFEREKAMEHYKVIDEDYLSRGIESKNPKLTKVFKERLAETTEFAIQNGKEVVYSEDWNKANDMIARLGECGLIKKRFSGKYQVEFNEDVDGIPLKGFLDCLNDDSIVDSKSARSIDKFKYDVNSWNYDIQAYLYTKVFNIKDFYWVVQEKTYPYFPADVKCSDETLFRGEMKFEKAVNNIERWLNKTEQTQTHYAEFTV
mgnify:FL=1